MMRLSSVIELVGSLTGCELMTRKPRQLKQLIAKNIEAEKKPKLGVDEPAPDARLTV
jgi:hypothetical protein